MKKTVNIVLAIILQSCTSQLYIPTSNVGEITKENLQKGRELYVTNCASCHQLYLPGKYDKKDWGTWLDDMQSKANISNQQKQLIYNYLVNAPK